MWAYLSILQALCLIAVLSVPCPIDPEPMSNSQTLTASVLDSIDTFNGKAAAFFEKQNGIGAAMGVWYNGEFVKGKELYLGTISPDSSLVPNGSTIFRIGSVTKSFTAAALFHAQQTGKVRSLDDPVSVYRSDFAPKTIYGTGQVTLRQLACHMSGLPRASPCIPQNCPESTTVIVSRVNQQLLNYPAYFEPSYSNLGFALLGRALFDTNYENYVTQNFFNPLGMKRTSFSKPSPSDGNVAIGYVSGVAQSFTEFGWEAPSGQAYSTLDDLGRWMGMIMGWSVNDTRPLSKATLAEWLLPLHINRDHESGWGAPWEIFIDSASGLVVLTKAGAIPGYNAVFAFQSKMKLGFAGLWNGGSTAVTTDTDTYVRMFNTVLLPAFSNMLLNGPKPIPTPPTNANRYLGVYVLPTPDKGPIPLNVTLDKNGNIELFNFLGFQINIPLKWAGAESPVPDAFNLGRLVFPGGDTCMGAQFAATSNNWLYFQDFTNGVFNSLSIPGYIPMGVFKRYGQ